jgi:hypothetical protein
VAQKFLNYMQGLRSAILAIFQTALKNTSQDLKNYFSLGAYEFLAILEGKIRVTPFL